MSVQTFIIFYYVLFSKKRKRTKLNKNKEAGYVGHPESRDRINQCNKTDLILSFKNLYDY